MAGVDMLKVPAELAASLGAAAPEEAAKLFMKMATNGMARAFADSVHAALIALTENGSQPDWTQLVKGCLLEFHWENPPGTQIQQCIGVPATAGSFVVAVKGDF